MFEWYELDETFEKHKTILDKLDDALGEVNANEESNKQQVKNRPRDKLMSKESCEKKAAAAASAKKTSISDEDSGFSEEAGKKEEAESPRQNWDKKRSSKMSDVLDPLEVS